MKARRANGVGLRPWAGAAPAMAAALCLVACHGRDDPDKATDAPARAPPPHPAGDGAAAESAIAGAVRGAPFTQVASAFRIESPDSDRATVIYLLSRPVRCIDLSFTGWDRALPHGTSVLEIEVLGKTAGSFLAVSSATLSPFEAAVEYERPSPDEPGNETRSTGGWVTIDTLSPQGPAAGTFTLDFGGDHLAGTFNALFCPGGHEP